MWDPDVPAASRPAWVHYIITDIIPNRQHGIILLNYMPPLPPSGIHRYFFTLYKQVASAVAMAAAADAIPQCPNFNLAAFVAANRLQKAADTYIKVAATNIIVGGKASKLEMIHFLNDNSNILGAGNFGKVISALGEQYKNKVVKILYDINSCDLLKQEGEIQKKARKLLKDVLIVPKIYDIFTFPTQFRQQNYLCGLIMDRVPNPLGFISFEEAVYSSVGDSQHEGFVDYEKSKNYEKDYIGPVHILLGYDQDDIDTVWGKSMAHSVNGTDNPPRGFHASPEMLEAIWEDEGSNYDLTIDKIAYIMGKSISTLIDGGIIPLDLEWIYGGEGRIYLIDFGLCEYRYIDKDKFLNGKSSRSISPNYYVPRKGMRGYDAFLKGYWS